MAWTAAPVANPTETQFLSVKLVKNGPRCAAKVEYRDGLWYSTLNGEPCGDPVDDENAAGGFIQGWRSVLHVAEEEYNYLLARYLHAKQFEPESPFANPDKAIRLTALPALGLRLKK
jgi:hypothetical protein